MKNNPYSLTFGKEPYKIISRSHEIDRMTEMFCSETPNTSVYIITGVRGSGKTVTMAVIADKLRSRKGWIVITLNPNRDLLAALAANLFEHPMLRSEFLKAEISFSFGVGGTVKEDGPTLDVEVQLKKMFQLIRKKGLRVMIAIDEVTNNKNFRIFASVYQMFLIEKYPVYLIMTGLYKNIHSLQNEDNLTFLYRAPKYELTPLSVLAMANNYLETMEISTEEADEMARLTKGYSYAFQVMGYLKFENIEKSVADLLPEFDETMEEYSYEKIWSELTAREKEIVGVLVSSETGRMRVKDIKAGTGTNDQTFPTYRRRLSGSGVISVSDYGYCELALPRFKEIVSRWR